MPQGGWRVRAGRRGTGRIAGQRVPALASARRRCRAAAAVGGGGYGGGPGPSHQAARCRRAAGGGPRRRVPGGGQQAPGTRYGGAPMPPPGVRRPTAGLRHTRRPRPTPRKRTTCSCGFSTPTSSPGYTYQYRIRVKMKNPNFGRKDVGRPDDAQQEVAHRRLGGRSSDTGDGDQRAEPVRRDPVEYRREGPGEVQGPGRGRTCSTTATAPMPVVQIQQWLEQVSDRVEAGAGRHLGGRRGPGPSRRVHRPEAGRLPADVVGREGDLHCSRRLPRYKVWKAREQPKGVLVDFDHASLLVDYEGGKVRPQIADRGVDDEAVTELLILRPDGTLTVRSSRRGHGRQGPRRPGQEVGGLDQRR